MINSVQNCYTLCHSFYHCVVVMTYTIRMGHIVCSSGGGGGGGRIVGN